MIDINFFDGVSPSILEQVCFTSKKYAKGATVHTQGKSCLTMDIVLSGSLIAYALSQNGSENVLFEFQKNSIIGANLLFGNANCYPMNIYCSSDCELLHIKKEDVLLLLHDYRFTIKFIKSISLNSQGMNKKNNHVYTKITARKPTGLPICTVCRAKKHGCYFANQQETACRLSWCAAPFSFQGTKKNER